MKYVTILGVLAVVLAGFVYFTLFSSPAHKTAVESNNVQNELSVDGSPNEDVAKPLTGVGTLEGLLQYNENLECTIIYIPGEQQPAVEGTYFVSDGKMRGDFLTQSPDLSGQILSSMIIDETNMYMWSEIDGEMYGVKMRKDSIETSPVQTNQPVALDADVEYTCHPWKSVDYTVFVPPTDILFKDMSELMKAGMEYGTVYEEGMEITQ